MAESFWKITCAQSQMGIKEKKEVINPAGLGLVSPAAVTVLLVARDQVVGQAGLDPRGQPHRSCIAIKSFRFW